MRVIVTGSRTWRDRNRIWEHLDLLATTGPLTVVHGDCFRGADSIASDWCQRHYVPRRYPVTEEPHPAQWKALGHRAGPIRNAEMAALGADAVLAYCAWCDDILCPRYDTDHMTHGTENMIKEARARNIEVIQFWEEDA